MRNLTTPYRTSIIHYTVSGNGRKKIVCFHGYGEEAKYFHFLSNYSNEDFTFFAIDLPFHGLTVWREELNFSPDDLVKIIEKILLENEGTGSKADYKFLLLGFSLGSRMALSLYQNQPEKIEKIIMLAPDGLKVNPWYYLATQTWMGNKFFAFTMRHPDWFLGFLKLLNKVKWVNSSIHKFVTYYIGDNEVRDLLYTRWTTFRKIKPDIKKIKLSILKYETPVRLIYGKHDRIILSSVGEKFRKGIEEYCTLSIINAGHQVLHEKHAGDILTALLQ
jgi:pimeloyl-ACP methyl ester carboxylesterase